MALETSPEQPAPVRVVAEGLRAWIGRLGAVWVEGQVAEITPRERTTYITLRDTEVEMSLRVSIATALVQSSAVAIEPGARIIVEARPEFWARNGSLMMRGTAVRAVGIGELLARIEHLKSILAAEGLFAAERKRPLPFLPGRVGLVCGRNSDAMHDVIENARARWPSVEFAVREVAVQGVLAVPQVVAALRELDADPGIDVIVVARGGGSIEDLLPFSDEGLVRAAAACTTPVVSAIGHEKDSPLLDLVADVRASTPTDAARRIVPDIAEQQRLVAGLRDRAYRALSGRVDADRAWLTAVRGRPLMASPYALVDERVRDIAALRARAHRSARAALDRGADHVAHLTSHLRAVSPQATLDRGYAVVRHPDGSLVHAPDDAAVGEPLRVRVAGGEFEVRRS